MTDVAESIEISLTVNGERVKRSVPARLNLADFLRNELELTGTHVGCEHGVRGAGRRLQGGHRRGSLGLARDRGAAERLRAHQRAAMRLLHARRSDGGAG